MATGRPQTMGTSQQAGETLLVANIPLIRAPGTWLPKPVQSPRSRSPALAISIRCPTISPFMSFVYPYTLEPSSLRYLSGLSCHPTNWETTLQSTQTYLEERRLRKEEERLRIEQQKEQSRLASLRLVAPGWNGAMEPILTAPPPASSSPSDPAPRSTNSS
ncbi:hypothetical protein VP01_481g3 [Puccinia sorghi]|uniref:Uncharacterized protein n=1 Tax=Puccinia sorghi TaxID=27349 RepID=A0A0L6UPH1_9BASI|nr:hypothetical protein VP01_481g3 [Puccinia sorghi]